MVNRWRSTVAGLALGVGVLAGCIGDQDPGVDPAIDPTGTEEPGTTSNTLGTCPPGGPDATTPAAGCIGPDGTVIRP